MATGNRRRHKIRAVGTHDEIDFVDVEQLGVNAGHIRGVRLVVITDQVDLAAKEPALGIGFLFPDLGAEQRLLAVGRERSGLGQVETDLDRILGHGGSGNDKSSEQECTQSAEAVSRKSLQSLLHR